MSVQIILTQPPYSVLIAREPLRAMKESLLAEALEMDPEAKEIQIDNPIVKPEHLELLVRMTMQEEIKVELPDDFDCTGICEAAKYLNWPLLEVIGCGFLYHVQAFAPNVNIYKPETYGSLLVWSLTSEIMFNGTYTSGHRSWTT